MTVQGKTWCLNNLCGLDISILFSGVLKPKEFITMYEKFFPANDANTFAEVTAVICNRKKIFQIIDNPK